MSLGLGSIVSFSGPPGSGLGGSSGSTSGVQKYAASFSSISSGFFMHGLGTRDVIVSIYDDSAPPREIIPDDIVLDTLNHISVLFNRTQSGRIIVIG